MDKQIIKELKEGTEPEVFGEALAFLERRGSSGMRISGN